MSPESILAILLPIFAFGIGAAIGSFLNVVIYRVPNGLSVNRPKRSFCPNCQKQIPIALNIPLLSWLMLRGKCKWCDVAISPRYFVVELLTGVVFLAIWMLKVPEADALRDYGILGEVFALWLLSSLLISATFIDFDHFIIPDSITIGGSIVGLVLSFTIPSLHNEVVWWKSGLQGALGIVVGFTVLWLVVLLGKVAFGKIRHAFDEPTEFSISQPGGDETPIMIKLGDREYEWGDVFFRKWDRLEMETQELFFNDEPIEFSESFRVFGDRFEVDGKRVEVEEVKRVSGKITSAVVPREAMGYGDVKFVAMIGAFQGWQCAVYVLFAASVLSLIHI